MNYRENNVDAELLCIEYLESYPNEDEVKINVSNYRNKDFENLSESKCIEHYSLPKTTRGSFQSVIGDISCTSKTTESKVVAAVSSLKPK